MWFMNLALAGTVTVDLEVFGEQRSLELQDVAGCAITRTEHTDDTLALALAAQVKPRGELLQIEVEIDARPIDRKSGAEVSLSPVFEVAPGEPGVLEIGSEEHPVRLEVEAIDFRSCDRRTRVTSRTSSSSTSRQQGSWARQFGRLIVHREDGEPVGLRVDHAKSAALEAGLRIGDILHSANGYPLTSIESAYDAYRALEGTNEVVLELTRDGERQKLSWDLR